MAITKGKSVLFSSFDRADSRPAQAKGIMFQPKLLRPLLFTFRNQRRRCIHSFFCPHFDAVFLDEEKKVVKVLSVNPWQSSICANCKYLIEFPAGTIDKFSLKNGDKLQW